MELIDFMWIRQALNYFCSHLRVVSIIISMILVMDNGQQSCRCIS